MTHGESDPLRPFRSLRSEDTVNWLNRNGLIIISGPEPLRRLLNSSIHVVSVLLKSDQSDEFADDLHQRTRAVENIITRTKREICDLVGYRVARGALACARRPPTLPLQWLLQAVSRARAVGTALRIMTVVHPQCDRRGHACAHTETLGALIRSAVCGCRCAAAACPCAAGACCDVYARRVVRVSMGHVLAARVVAAAADVNAADVLTVLHESGVQLYVAADVNLSADAQSLDGDAQSDDEGEAQRDPLPQPLNAPQAPAPPPLPDAVPVSQLPPAAAPHSWSLLFCAGGGTAALAAAARRGVTLKPVRVGAAVETGCVGVAGLTAPVAGSILLHALRERDGGREARDA